MKERASSYAAVACVVAIAAMVIGLAIEILAMDEPEEPPPQGRIAYGARAPGESYDIHVFSFDTGRKWRVTSGPKDELDPSWSPDGHWIAYRRATKTLAEPFDDVWVVRADGRFARQLEGPAGDSYSPAWSPDGTRIAYASNFRGGGYQIWTVPATGGAATWLRTAGEYPTWEPNGRRLLFSRYSGPTDWDIWIMNDDGSGSARVLEEYGREYLPAWSPDGRRVAFSRGYDGERKIWVMDATTGRDLDQLTFGQGDDFAPAWSPDGAHIVFARNGELSVISARGGKPRSLGIAGELPSWGN